MFSLRSWDVAGVFRGAEFARPKKFGGPAFWIVGWRTRYGYGGSWNQTTEHKNNGALQSAVVSMH